MGNSCSLNSSDDEFNGGAAYQIGSNLSMHVSMVNTLDPDRDLLRGISLNRSLIYGGYLWRHCPTTRTTAQRMALYEKSIGADRLDIFISHTWWTPGWTKVVALFLQSTWHILLTSWAVAVLLISVLCIHDILPMPFSYEANVGGWTGHCPMGCWALVMGSFLPLMSSFAAIHVPRFCDRSPLCFVDVACIHQEDEVLMQRGLKSMGGFLAVSQELRVLWSAPYLSRLWCVFELAAFRKANPTGKIRLAPVFVEMAVLYIWLWICSQNFLTFFLARSSKSAANFAYVVMGLPVIPGVHALRRNYGAKRKLLIDLAEFALDKASCYSESDRQYIESAISDWYGSTEAFTRYVHDTLCQDLVEQVRSSRLPWPYMMFLVTTSLSFSVETMIALWRGGAPVESLLSWGVGLLLGTNCIWLPTGLLLLLYLSDRHAAIEMSVSMSNYLQTLGISAVIVFYFLLVGATGGFAVVSGPTAASVWVLTGLVLAGCLFGRPRKCSRRNEQPRVQ